MDVRRQVAGLRSWLPLLIASAVLAGGLAYLASGLLPKVYEAKSTLLIGQSLSAVNPDFAQLQASQQLSNTYVKLATTRQIMVAVIDKLGLKDTPQSLERRVQAATPINSTLLDITVTDPNADAAAAIANEIAAQVIKASPDLQGQEEQIRQFVAADLAATQAQIEATQTEVNRLAGLPTRTAAEDAQLNLLESRLTSLRASYAGLLSFASNDASNLVSLFDPAVALKDPDLAPATRQHAPRGRPGPAPRDGDHRHRDLLRRQRQDDRGRRGGRRPADPGSHPADAGRARPERDLPPRHAPVSEIGGGRVVPDGPHEPRVRVGRRADPVAARDERAGRARASP